MLHVIRQRPISPSFALLHPNTLPDSTHVAHGMYVVLGDHKIVLMTWIGCRGERGRAAQPPAGFI